MGEIVTVRQAKFFDFEALRDAVQDAQSDIVQIEQGKMTGMVTHLAIDSVGASVGDFTRGVRQRGELSPDRWTFGFVEKPAQVCYYDMAPGDLFLLAPGNELYSSFSGANGYTTVFVKPDELFAFIAGEPGAQDAAAWHQPASLLTGQGTAVARELSALLAGLAEHGPKMSPEIAGYHKNDVLELITALVLEGSADRYRSPRLSHQSAVELVRDVERFMIGAGARPVSVSELVKHFGVPRRSLFSAFEDVLGVSPMQFSRRKRLGDAHSALLMAMPGDTVDRIRTEHGFLDGGRFAKSYHSQFGEWPHETLLRPRHRWV
ncbi:helix-turn-helix domain-containing protein [Bradyrhizobium elkanii]|uniref:helix-turn-helix domain-containing protein n=1 Tax=Bradyrhizobium elkanii TaxID=29448 RepID=UPI0004B7D3F2|nr:helix-turn-helix domain-containing protein [Bradyrhizobium elkanii]WLA79539.1 helix-turn-helix domain-containing protein [Bradyrhizobium elkanii]